MSVSLAKLPEFVIPFAGAFVVVSDRVAPSADPAGFPYLYPSLEQGPARLAWCDDEPAARALAARLSSTADPVAELRRYVAEKPARLAAPTLEELAAAWMAAQDAQDDAEQAYYLAAEDPARFTPAQVTAARVALEAADDVEAAAREALNAHPIVPVAA